MAHYIYETGSAGNVAHAIGSAGSGEVATLAAAQTADAWSAADTIDVRGDAFNGNLIPTGNIVLSTLNVTITLINSPILTGAPASGTAGVVNITNSGVKLQANTAWRLRNTGAIGHCLVVDADVAGAPLTGIYVQSCIVDKNGTVSGLYPVYIQQQVAGNFSVSGTFDDCVVNAGNGSEDGFAVAGNCATAGLLRFNRCIARGCNNSSISNGFAMDGNTHAILVNCETYDCGGPGIAGGIGASLPSRVWCYGCRTTNSNSHASATTGGYAMCCERTIQCTLTNELSGIFIGSTAVNVGAGVADQCVVLRDQSRYADSTSNNICTGISFVTLDTRITNCHIKGYRWGKDASYYHTGVAKSANLSVTYRCAIAGNFFEDVCQCITAGSRDGLLLIQNNVFWSYNLPATVAAAARANHIEVTGASAGGLKLYHSGNVHLQGLDGATYAQSYVGKAASTVAVVSENNYWWKADATTPFASWTTGATDNPASGTVTNTSAGTKPLFNIDAGNALTDGLQLADTSPSIQYGPNGLLLPKNPPHVGVAASLSH